MGFFDLFKKTPTIQDEFFGTLKFLDSKDASKNYFEGKGHFRPTGQEIEYFISGDITGPTKEQRDFYNYIQDNYDTIISKITPMIEEEFQNWKEFFTIQDFKAEFSLVALTIPRLAHKPILWDLSFETIHDENHQVTINFKDIEPDSIQIDG